MDIENGDVLARINNDTRFISQADVYLGGIERDEGGAIVVAKAALVFFLVKEDADRGSVSRWESFYIENSLHREDSRFAFYSLPFPFVRRFTLQAQRGIR